SARQIVDNGPFFGDANRILQRQDDASGADLRALSRCGNRGTRDRGIGIQTAKLVEVPLRGPDGAKAVRVGKPGALQKEPVLILGASLVAVEVEKAELHRGLLLLRARATDGRGRRRLF